VGTQLLVLVLFIFAMALVGFFYPYNRGAPYTAAVILYALTAGISGYVSASLYREMGGQNWARNVGHHRRALLRPLPRGLLRQQHGGHRLTGPPRRSPLGLLWWSLSSGRLSPSPSQ